MGFTRPGTPVSACFLMWVRRSGSAYDRAESPCPVVGPRPDVEIDGRQNQYCVFRKTDRHKHRRAHRLTDTQTRTEIHFAGTYPPSMIILALLILSFCHFEMRRALNEQQFRYACACACAVACVLVCVCVCDCVCVCPDPGSEHAV